MTVPVRMSLIIVAIAAFAIITCTNGVIDSTSEVVIVTRTLERNPTVTVAESQARQAGGDSLSEDSDEEEYIITYVDPPGGGSPVAVESRVKGTDSASSTDSNSGQADGGEDGSQDQQPISSDDEAHRVAWIDPPGPEGPFAISVVDDGKPVEFEVDAPSE